MKRTVYTDDHEQFRGAVREYVRRHVLPDVESHAENKLIPREVWREAGTQGILGLEIPEAYDGGGANDYRFNAVAMEELAAVNMALAASFGIHFDIVAPYVVDLASDEQKSQWLPKMASGEAVAAIAMTEPSAGSDLASLKTTAVRDDPIGYSTAPRLSSRMVTPPTLLSSQLAPNRTRVPEESACSSLMPRCPGSREVESWIKSGNPRLIRPSCSSTGYDYPPMLYLVNLEQGSCR